MRGILFGLVLVLGVGVVGCRHSARRAACPTGDCYPSLGEPVSPRTGRIDPTPVPVYPSQVPPREIPETRNFAPEPIPRPSARPAVPLSPAPTTPAPTPTVPPREILESVETPAPRSGPTPLTKPFPTVPTLPSTATQKPAATPAPPATPNTAGLPGYATVPGRAGVATGRKPMPAGFDTLKDLNYRSVLYIHDPETDVSAARELATARGLTFTALAVRPETLATNLATFTPIIQQSASKPVYVVDESGVRAGSLWYLFFRTVERAGDDVARVKATSLGLPADTTTDEAKDFWLAVQQILARG